MLCLPSSLSGNSTSQVLYPCSASLLSLLLLLVSSLLARLPCQLHRGLTNTVWSWYPYPCFSGESPGFQLVGPVSLAACDSSTLPSTYLLASFVSSEVSHARDRITQTYILSHTKLLPGGLVQSLFLPSEPEVVAVVSHIASSAKLTTHNHISQNGEI